MSALSDALAEYLDTRRALGARLRWHGTALRHFINFVEQENVDFITIEIALRWAVNPAGISAATRATRLTMVRGFAAWLHASDPRTQVPPHGILPAGKRRPTPHIFSKREINDLMSATHCLRSKSGLRPRTYETLFGLLYATGLRPGEAIALNSMDVDFSNSIIIVREAKFDKSRLVPIDTSTCAALMVYAEYRDALFRARKSDAFLVSDDGRRLRSENTRNTFAKLSQTTGLRSPSAPRRIGRGPRLQDLRHTVCYSMSHLLVSRGM